MSEENSGVYARTVPGGGTGCWVMVRRARSGLTWRACTNDDALHAEYIVNMDWVGSIAEAQYALEIVAADAELVEIPLSVVRKRRFYGKWVKPGEGLNPHISPHVHDIAEYWGDAVAAIEKNLKMDAREWAKYQDYPRPYLHDLLSDYGKFPDDMAQDDVDLCIRDALTIAGYELRDEEVVPDRSGPETVVVLV